MVLIKDKKKARIVKRDDFTVILYDNIDIDEDLLDSIKDYLEGRVLTLEQIKSKPTSNNKN